MEQDEQILEMDDDFPIFMGELEAEENEQERKAELRA